MTWLTGWTYRRSITITEQSGSDLTDYQVKIELNSSNFDFSKANADGSDIRFAAEDGTTLLPYWIEEWDSGNQTAKIWVKIPSLLANSSITIYMYYGNENAVSESNAEEVFDFYDDFNGTDLDFSKWKKEGNLNYSLSNGMLTIEETAGTWGFIRPLKNFPSRNIVFEAYRKHNSGSEVNHYIHNYDANRNIWENKSWYRAETRTTDTYGNSGSEVNHYIHNYDANRNIWENKIWYRAETRTTDTYGITRYTQSDSSQTQLYRTSLEINIFRLYSVAIDDTNIKFYVDNVLKYSEACRLSELDRLYYSISLWYYGNGTIDWVRVRKYADPEPTFTVSAEGVPISGIVKLSDGTPVSGATVICIREDTNTIVGVTTSQTDGSYTVSAAEGVKNTVIVIPSDGTQNGDIKCHIVP